LKKKNRRTSSQRKPGRAFERGCISSKKRNANVAGGCGLIAQHGEKLSIPKCPEYCADIPGIEHPVPKASPHANKKAFGNTRSLVFDNDIEWHSKPQTTAEREPLPIPEMSRKQNRSIRAVEERYKFCKVAYFQSARDRSLTCESEKKKFKEDFS
jgi:hypothetical protein